MRLNCRATITFAEELTPSLVVGPLLENLDAVLTAHRIRIAHLKAMDECSSGYVKASIVRNGEEPFVQGTLDASPAAAHEMLLNLRAIAEPDVLRRLVEDELAKLAGSVTITNMQCFSPAAPEPEYRLSSVVALR